MWSIESTLCCLCNDCIDLYRIQYLFGSKRFYNDVYNIYNAFWLIFATIGSIFEIEIEIYLFIRDMNLLQN